MGIIAILIAVSLSSITAAIKYAQTAKCSSNMRQIGNGFQEFLADHNNVLPQRYYPATDTGYALQLAPYTGNNTNDKVGSIFYCPAHRACTYPLEPSYGMNWYYDNMNAMVVTQPTTTILAAETVGGDGTGSNRADKDSGDPGELDPTRHNGMANYLFFDGHVEKLAYSATTNYGGSNVGNHSLYQSPPN